jgi:hypothetical protein
MTDQLPTRRRRRNRPLGAAWIKSLIRERDGFRCTECGCTQAEHFERFGRDLDVHRITPGSPYSLDEGVCQTLCRVCHGPKPKSPRGSAGFRWIKFPSDLILKAKMVAYWKGMTLTAYINSVLRPLVEADFAKEIRESGE